MSQAAAQMTGAQGQFFVAPRRAGVHKHKVASKTRLRPEWVVNLGRIWRLRPQALASDFALDQAGAEDYRLLPLAAFILVSLDLIVDQGDAARRAVHEATLVVQNVIILGCQRKSWGLRVCPTSSSSVSRLFSLSVATKSASAAWALQSTTSSTKE